MLLAANMNLTLCYIIKADAITPLLLVEFNVQIPTTTFSLIGLIFEKMN
jgi:hypothetical protein